MTRRRKGRTRTDTLPEPLRKLEQRERERKELERMMSSHDTFHRRNGKVRAVRHGCQDIEGEEDD